MTGVSSAWLGVSAPNSRSVAVAVSRHDIPQFGARGREVREVRAATSVRRVGVKRSCAAFGLPRVVGGREGPKERRGGCRA